MRGLRWRPKNLWAEYLENVAKMFRAAEELARLGRPTLAAFILTMWAIWTAACVALIVLILAYTFTR